MPLSLYQHHVQRWKDCQRCPLSEGRQRVVLARGTVPCDVLFVGEAPGESEDVLGQPFKGPAGQLLDRIVRLAMGPDRPLRCAYTNLVCCIPRDPDGGKATEPGEEGIQACSPRLQEFIRLCDDQGGPDPLRMIVCVGALARDYLEPGYKHSIPLPRPIRRIELKHPAAILRANVAQRGLEIERQVWVLRNALEEL